VKSDLDILEHKVAQLVKLSQSLRAENHQLRQSLAESETLHRQCDDKLTAAKSRLKKLLTLLPEDA
jgi:regulator of replication initiation timing